MIKFSKIYFPTVYMIVYSNNKKSRKYPYLSNLFIVLLSLFGYFTALSVFIYYVYVR